MIARVLRALFGFGCSAVSDVCGDMYAGCP